MVEAISEAFFNFLLASSDSMKQVPGLRIIINYIEKSYQNDPFRVFLELLLFGWMVYYTLKQREKKDSSKLTHQEIERLVEEWEPEPLVPPQRSNLRTDEDPVPTIAGQSNLKITLTTGQQLQNWATTNFLGLQNNSDITEAAIKTVRQYGVGACGPAGFYGSMDVHLELEKRIADLLEVEEAIVYSQGFMAVASVIPAFSKKGDILVADDGCSFAVQTGLEISRSTIYYFHHNDMKDLKRVLEQVDGDCKRKKMPLSRRFIVVEGLYAKSGDKCLLPKLLEIKKNYKYRLIIDESLSFGCLGPRGLGITDFYGIPASSVEIIVGSFSNSLGSSGGFCAGSHAVVDHQRLSSQAYCFSAALPALLTVSASLALQQIESHPEMLLEMRRNIVVFSSIINSKLPQLFSLFGDSDSPLRMLRLAKHNEDITHETSIIHLIIKKMRARGYLLTSDKHSPREKFIPSPSVKICISAGFSERETDAFAHALIECLEEL